jgi:hypothetical protein
MRWFNIISRTASEVTKGENNPMFGKKRPEMQGKNNPNYKEKIKVKCSYCNKILRVNPYRIVITKNFFCNEEHFYEWKKLNLLGENNPNWNNGSSFGEYGQEFDSSLKEQIRFRDKYKCRDCGCSQLENDRALDVHHIDYNKQNCKQDNLISLCRRCHTKTNGNRNYWANILMEKLNGTIS